MSSHSLERIFSELVAAHQRQDYTLCVQLATHFLTQATQAQSLPPTHSQTTLKSKQDSTPQSKSPHSKPLKSKRESTSPQATLESNALHSKHSTPRDSTPQNTAQTARTSQVAPQIQAQVWFICAMSLYYLGDELKAVQYLANAQNLAPNDESIAINLSELLRKQGRLKDAALSLTPFLPSSNPDVYFNLARILSQANDIPSAITLYQEVLKLSPNDTQAAYNLANLYVKDGAYTQAIALYKTCPTLEAQFNLAHTFTLVDDMESALALYKSLEQYFAPRLREVNESQDFYQAYNISRAEFYFNYANALRYAGKSREAERMYQKSYMVYPKLEYVINYAHLLLSVGVFERGFGYYQERLKLPKQEMDNTRFFKSSRHIAILPEPAAIRECIKNARVLIFHEQGFGDSIMFARFIDMLECREKYLFVQAPLRRLFAERFCVVDEFFNDFDYCISLPSLPYVLGIAIVDDFQHNATYLANTFPKSKRNANELQALLDSSAQSMRESSLQGLLHSFTNAHKQKPIESSEPLKIGIFFHSNPNFAYASYKSLPLSKLLATLRLCAQKGLQCTIHALQPESLESIIDEQCSIQPPIIKRKPIENNAPDSSSLDSASSSLNTAESNSLEPNSSAKTPQKQHTEQHITIREIRASHKPIHANAHALDSTQAESSTPESNTLESAHLSALLDTNTPIPVHTYHLHDFYDTAQVLRDMDIVISVDSVVAHLAIALGVPCAALVYKRYDWRWGELGKIRFNGFCGAEVFAQNTYGKWDNVLQDLESYLLNLA